MEEVFAISYSKFVSMMEENKESDLILSLVLDDEVFETMRVDEAYWNVDDISRLKCTNVNEKSLFEGITYPISAVDVIVYQKDIDGHEIWNICDDLGLLAMLEQDVQ